jgi:anti-anti-sigma factor
MTTYTPVSFAQTFREGTLIVELKGAIDSALSLDAAMESAVVSAAKSVVIVLTGIEYINSAGFSAVIRFSDAVTEAGQTLYVVGLESKVHIVFQSLGAHSVLNILPNLNDAMARIAEDQKK